MIDDDEVRALTEELERLNSETKDGSCGPEAVANRARQMEIRARLAELGRPAD